MTRINCIPPTMLLDEHLQASVREGLRPINEVLNGKANINNAPDSYKLGTGHVLFCKKHLLFTKRQFELAQREYHLRGFNGFNYGCPTLDVSTSYLNDYEPTIRDLRTNLARIIERFRKRKKPYHFRGKVVDSNKVFRLYYKQLKRSVLEGIYDG